MTARRWLGSATDDTVRSREVQADVRERAGRGGALVLDVSIQTRDQARFASEATDTLRTRTVQAVLQRRNARMALVPDPSGGTARRYTLHQRNSLPVDVLHVETTSVSRQVTADVYVEPRPQTPGVRLGANEEIVARAVALAHPNADLVRVAGRRSYNAGRLRRRRPARVDESQPAPLARGDSWRAGDVSFRVAGGTRRGTHRIRVESPGSPARTVEVRARIYGSEDAPAITVDVVRRRDVSAELEQAIRSTLAEQVARQRGGDVALTLERGFRGGVRRLDALRVVDGKVARVPLEVREGRLSIATDRLGSGTLTIRQLGESIQEAALSLGHDVDIGQSHRAIQGRVRPDLTLPAEPNASAYGQEFRFGELASQGSTVSLPGVRELGSNVERIPVTGQRLDYGEFMQVEARFGGTNPEPEVQRVAQAALARRVASASGKPTVVVPAEGSDRFLITYSSSSTTLDARVGASERGFVVTVDGEARIPVAAYSTTMRTIALAVSRRTAALRGATVSVGWGVHYTSLNPESGALE